MITTPAHATTPVPAAQPLAHSTPHFASENTFRALDTESTDDESPDLLSAPDETTDLPSSPEPPVLLTPALLGNNLQRLDEKWTTILTGYNNAQDAQRCRDDEQRLLDRDEQDAQRRRDDEQRRLDRETQHQINTELRRSKKMEFDAFLASSKEAFAVEMKETLAGFRSELSSWTTNTVAEVRVNVTTLSEEITALSETVKSLDEKVGRETVTTISEELRGDIMTLSATVQTLDDKVNRAQAGHVTETALPSLSSRLDILERRATGVPINVARVPPPPLPPEPNAAPPPAVLPVVLTSDPPDETTPLPPRVPAVAARAHLPAQPRPHMASPVSPIRHTGHTADQPEDPVANSRVAFAALHARMSQEAANGTIGHANSARPPTRNPSPIPMSPTPTATSRRNVTPNQPAGLLGNNTVRYRQSTIREALLRGGARESLLHDGITLDNGGEDVFDHTDHYSNESLGHDDRDTLDALGSGHNGHAPNTARDVRVRGAPIVPNRDRSQHARTLGASRFDVMKLATQGYHAGMDGVDVLTDGFIHECGYGIVKATVEDVVVCFNDIIMVHRRVRDLWHNNYAHTMGPQVSTILSKHIKVFPQLDSLGTEEMVAFYDRLQEVGSNYVIALIPFDAIVLSYRFEGLCPPGLGLLRYAAMSKALMELLPWLISTTLSPQIGAAIACVRHETGNGYDFLWRVLALLVPGFDPTIPIQAPIWSEVMDIFTFAQEYLLFFRLQAKLNFHYNDRTRSGLFLRSVQSSQFADTITLLQSHINSYREEFEDGYLPPNLRLHGLATSLSQNALSRIRDIATPRARRLGCNQSLLDDATSRVQGVPSIYRMERPRAMLGERAPRRDDGDLPRGRDYSDRSRTVRFPPAQGPPDHRRDSSDRPHHGPGRLARPDRNRRPYMKDQQCAACRRVGHVAKHCDMLATAICLEKYMKTHLSPSLRDQVEKEWLDRWKEKLDNPIRTPRQVLRSYVADLGITVSDLDAAMEWNCWDTDEDDEADDYSAEE